MSQSGICILSEKTIILGNKTNRALNTQPVFIQPTVIDFPRQASYMRAMIRCSKLFFYRDRKYEIGGTENEMEKKDQPVLSDCYTLGNLFDQAGIYFIQ
jgi:hypothetical protein